jgi:hypothetical protein
MSKKQNATMGKDSNPASPTPAELIQTLKDRKASAKTEYTALVGRIHAGESVTADESLEILRLAGKSPDDLEEAVMVLKRIDELQAIIAESPALHAERTEFLTKSIAVMDALKVERLALEQKIRTAEQGVFGSHDQFRFRQQRIDAAQQELNSLQRLHPPTVEAVAPVRHSISDWGGTDSQTYLDR